MSSVIKKYSPYRMTKAIRLYDYQNEIKLRLMEAWQSHRSVMVQMPTGTGKTHVLAALVSEELSCKQSGKPSSLELSRGAADIRRSQCGTKCVEHNGANVIIVAHRRELVAQIEEIIERYGINIEDGRVRVMSIQWLSRHWTDVEDVPGLVVIDEAHHALAKTYRMMWEAWPEARFLGLTATPCRLNGSGFTDLFDVLLTSHAIGRFIHEGWLSLFDYYSIKADSEEQRLINSLEKRGADGDYQAKELNAVLNRRPTIERLYESVCRYAEGKKGIVYAINIDHAHNIAEYYRGHGIDAVAIDSKTPADIRRQTVDDFKAGRIKIMVSVDLFSEGFDCPDVEFIQLARPTLSLAKYLQMVGRGLRKSEGKETCVMIDNVGLYRMFGLPAADRDWQAMFEGRKAGKGNRARCNAVCNYAVTADVETATTPDTDMEEIIGHESLTTLLACNGMLDADAATDGKLRAFLDRESGLYGLKRGEKITIMPQYAKVFDVSGDFAAVKFPNGTTGLVDGEGNIMKRLERNAYLRLTDNGILSITGRGDKTRYVDLRNGMEYMSRPVSVWFGRVEMLRVGDRCYGRMRHPYKAGFPYKKHNIKDKGFYIDIFMNNDPDWYRMQESMGKPTILYSACILADDDTDWYIVNSVLEDGSIIILDSKKNYYHVEDGKEKRYIGNEQDDGEIIKLISAINRLRAKVRTSAERMQAERQQRRLVQLLDAEPFCSNNKWGLRLDGRIIVPPIYRTVRCPVGKYCAIEKNYSQWGVVALDGTVVVEPKYSDIEISTQGIVTVTKVTGSKELLRLP